MADYTSDYEGATIELLLDMVNSPDTTPTDASSNLITSGGVFTALADKQDGLTFDTTPTSGSTNPVTSGGVLSALDEKADTDDIPTALSDLTDDSSHRTVTDTEKATWDAKADTTDIPDVSEFITNSVSDLTYYYLKSETYTQSEVDALIAAINQFHYEVFESLDDITDPESNVLYLIGPSGSGTDLYEEYVYTTEFVKIGDTSIDLTDYVTTSALNTALASYVTSSALATALADYTNTTDLETLLDAKADKDTDAVEGNIAMFDSEGNPVDSDIEASDVSGILDGSNSVPLADNLTSWESRSSLSVEQDWSGVVQTTGGDVSIDSDTDMEVVSIAPESNFYASAIVNTGFNILRYATAVGDGYYMLVPALIFGTYGTATTANGLLFTDADGNNLTPTVYFKALSDGVPTSVTDGSECAYTDSNGYRFYNTSEEGYIIVSDITLSETCAHVAWSTNYDKYVSVSDTDDAGSTITISSVISALHSYNLMLLVGNVSDKILYYSATQFQYVRNNDRVAASWTTVDNGDDTYTHTATISGMLSGGAAYIGSSDGTEDESIALSVDGSTVSYTDSSSSATSEYVYYNLATAVTGLVTVTPSGAINDFGLTYYAGASGEAYTSMRYAQGYPDSVAALVAGGLDTKLRVLVEAVVSMQTRLAGIEEAFANGLAYLSVGKLVVESLCGLNVDGNFILVAEGAPSTSVEPTNWDSDKYGDWMGIPQFIGQIYVDTTNSIIYMAIGTASISSWKRISNA